MPGRCDSLRFVRQPTGLIQLLKSLDQIIAVIDSDAFKNAEGISVAQQPKRIGSGREAVIYVINK